MASPSYAYREFLTLIIFLSTPLILLACSLLEIAVEHRLHSPFAFAELLSVHLYVNASSQIAYLDLLRELIHFTLHEIR